MIGQLGISILERIVYGNIIVSHECVLNILFILKVKSDGILKVFLFFLNILNGIDSNNFYEKGAIHFRGEQKEIEKNNFKAGNRF